MDKITAIALTTFRELVRSSVLYIVLFFAAAIVLLAAALGSVTIGDQLLVIKDFGLASASFFSVIFAVIAGTQLLHKELSRKTIYNILCKPVERRQFLGGKFLGMLITTACLIACLNAALMLFVGLMSGQADWLLAYAGLYMLLEAAVICAAAIFFSSLVVTPVLSGLFTLGFFLAGRAADYLLYFVNEGSVSGLIASTLGILHALLPQLARLNVSNAVVFHDWTLLGAVRFFWAALYSLGYAAVLLILANLIFKRRDFN